MTSRCAKKVKKGMSGLACEQATKWSIGRREISSLVCPQAIIEGQYLWNHWSISVIILMNFKQRHLAVNFFGYLFRWPKSPQRFGFSHKENLQFSVFFYSSPLSIIITRLNYDFFLSEWHI